MIKVFKKAQKDYIDAMLSDSTTKAPWAEKDGIYFIANAEGSVAYFIPEAFLHIRLDEARKSFALDNFIPDPIGMEAAEVVYTDAQGRTKIQSEHHTVYVYEKNLKPFLAAKGANLAVTGPLAPVRVYVAGSPFCIGMVMPLHPNKVKGGV